MSVTIESDYLDSKRYVDGNVLRNHWYDRGLKKTIKSSMYDNIAVIIDNNRCIWSEPENLAVTNKDIVKFCRDIENAFSSSNFSYVPQIRKVEFHDPATIVWWEDNTKTVVKCGEYDKFNPEFGLAMAISKKALGNKYEYYDVFKKWIPQEYWDECDIYYRMRLERQKDLAAHLKNGGLIEVQITDKKSLEELHELYNDKEKEN